MQEIIFNIILVLLFTFILWLLWYRGYKKKALIVVLGFVQVAEEAWDRHTGTQKFNEVMARIYSELPILFRILLPMSEAIKLIDSAFNIMQNQINGALNTIEDGRVVPKGHP